MKFTFPSIGSSRTMKIAILFAIWWISNTAFAIDAEILFRKHDLKIHPLDCAIFQTIVGLLFVFIRVLLSSEKSPTIRSYTAWLVGSLHFIASAFTSASYYNIGASATLIWKLTEPLPSIILKWIILGVPTTLFSVSSVLVVLIGTATFSFGNYKIDSYLPVFTSNVIYPLRNVLVKFEQRLGAQASNQQPSSHFSYSEILLHGVPLTLLATVYRLESIVSFPFPLVLSVLRNAILFNVYQFVSISLLAFMDPLSHALLNTFKRFTGIVIVTIWLQNHLSIQHVVGFLIALTGFLGHSVSSMMLRLKSQSDSSRIHRKAVLLIQLMGLSLLPLVFPCCSHLVNGSIVPIYFNSPILVESAERDMKNPFLDMKEVLQSSEVVHILLGHHPSSNSSAHSNMEFTEITERIADFRLCYDSIHTLLDMSNDTVVKCDKTMSCIDEIGKAFSGQELTIHLPCGQFQLAEENYVLELAQLYASREHVRRVIINGISLNTGMPKELTWYDSQLDSRKNSSLLFTITSRNERMLKSLQPLPVDMAVQGKFTEHSIQYAGYFRATSTGSPALFLSKNLYLGKVLKEKYLRLHGLIGDRYLRVAVTVDMFWKNQNLFPRIGAEYPNSIFYAQTEQDMTLMKAFGIPLNRTRFFSDPDEWVESLREMDLSFGPRMHGHMLAIAAEVPVVVIATTYETLELVHKMNLPFVTHYSELSQTEGEDLAKLGYTRDFNGNDFDKNRCKIAGEITRVYERSKMRVQPHVRAIRQQC